MRSVVLDEDVLRLITLAELGVLKAVAATKDLAELQGPQKLDAVSMAPERAD